jgi:hypothetical protein
VRLEYRAEIGPWDEPVMAARIRGEIAAGRRHLRFATAHLTATR